MLWTVIRIEWRNLAGERAVWVVMALFAGLVIYAAINGGRDAGVRRTAIAEAGSEQAERMGALAVGAQEGAKDPHKVGRELGRQLAALPPAPLASLSVSRGEPLEGARVVSTETRLGAATGEAAVSSPTRQLTGSFDLTFVFIYLLPLVVIALTYDLVAGERERGTLALVLAQPVSLATFVLGKTLQRAGLLIGVVLALGLLAPAIGGGSPGESLMQMTLLGALLVTYTMFWFMAAVAVNAWGATAAGNALALVGLWLLLVVIVPGFVTVAVDTAYPPPSRVELVNLTREAARDAEGRISTLEGEHGPAASAGDRYKGTLRRAVEVQEDLERQVAPVIEAFGEQMERRQHLVTNLRFVSPAIVLHEGLSDLAGDGMHRRRHFTAQVDRFHEAWKAFFFQRIRGGAPMAAADYDALPRFTYREEPDAALTSRVGAGIAGLVLPALALLGIGLAGLRRIGRLT